MTFPSISRLFDTKLSQRQQMLVSYLNHFFETPPGQNLLCLTLIESFVRTLQTKNAEVSEIVGRNGWFALDMIIKSAQLTLSANNMLDESINRNSRFGDNVGVEIAKLVALMLEEVKSKPTMARVINENVAFFLKDLLTFYDRGLVMDLIYLYESKIPDAAVQIRFEFLRIICDYEHYVQLNLPLPDRIADIPTLEMTLWTNHFLAGVLVQEVAKQLRTRDWSSIQPAVDTLFFLLFKHSIDPRYQSLLAQKCIPGIYFGFVIKMIDINNETHRVLADAPLAIRRKVLACFLWIVNNIQRKVLQQWWNLDTPKRVISFFIILASAVDAFEYLREETGKGDLSDILKSTKLRSMSVVGDDNKASRPNLSASGKDHRSTLMNRGTYSDLQEQNASREVTLVAIDLLMDFMNDQVTELRRPDSTFMDRVVINLLVLMLCRHQCSSVLCSLFAAVRHTIVMFPNSFFIEQSPYCGEIAYAILRHLDSSHADVRSKAGALFYLLLRVSNI